MWDFSFYFNRYNHLSKDEIIKLSSSSWEIGSHGQSHRSFLELEKDELKAEIFESKKILEDITSNKVLSIAPPFSQINQRAYDYCVEAGYKYIYLQNHVDIKESQSSSIIKRKNVYSIDTNRNIINKLKNKKDEQ